MMSRVTGIICGAGIAALIGLSWLVNHYRDNAATYKEQRDTARSELSLAKATITDMTARQREVATLDAKYTGELADAKAKLEALQQCVSAGKCGLRVNATCGEGNASGTTGVDDAARPRLTDSAQRDYFTLRKRIETVTKQLIGLQHYVYEQCLM